MAPVKSVLAASLLFGAQLVAGHAAIIGAKGNAGGSGMALGVDSSTPRDGTRRNPFQQDATRFRGSSADTFGETVGAGDNSLEQGTSSIMAETGDQLPQVTPGGELTMTLHQVNSDGAGPYKCMINADGTGATWENIQVTQNVDGNRRGRNRDGNASDHPLVAAIPQDQQCTGTVAGENNVCLVRCQNPANAGPFGGVVPVQMASAAAVGGAGPVPGVPGGVVPGVPVATPGATPIAAPVGTVPVGNVPAGNAPIGNIPAGGAAPATGATPVTGGNAGNGNTRGGNNNNNDDEEEEDNATNGRGNGRGNRQNNRRAVEFTA